VDTSTITFCTKLNYTYSRSLRFETKDGDHIIANINHWFNSSFNDTEDWDYSIQLEANFEGIEYSSFDLQIDKEQGETKVQISELGNNEFALSYINNNRFIAFDDLKGNQWLLLPEDPSIFFCKASFYNYKNTATYDLWFKLKNAKKYKSQDDSILISQEDNWQYLYEWLISKVFNSCPDDNLNIYRTADLKRSLDSDPTISISSNRFTPSSYTFHDNLDLGSKKYSDVYIYGVGDNLLYFTWDNGVVAFKSIEGELLYQDSQ